MAEAQAAVEHRFEGEFTQKEKQNFTSIFFFFFSQIIYLPRRIMSGNDLFFFLPRFPRGPWKLRACGNKKL